MNVVVGSGRNMLNVCKYIYIHTHIYIYMTKLCVVYSTGFQQYCVSSPSYNGVLVVWKCYIWIYAWIPGLLKCYSYLTVDLDQVHQFFGLIAVTGHLTLLIRQGKLQENRIIYINKQQRTLHKRTQEWYSNSMRKTILYFCFRFLSKASAARGLIMSRRDNFRWSNKWMNKKTYKTPTIYFK